MVLCIPVELVRRLHLARNICDFVGTSIAYDALDFLDHSQSIGFAVHTDEMERKEEREKKKEAHLSLIDSFVSDKH